MPSSEGDDGVSAESSEGPRVWGWVALPDEVGDMGAGGSSCGGWGWGLGWV